MRPCWMGSSDEHTVEPEESLRDEALLAWRSSDGWGAEDLPASSAVARDKQRNVSFLYVTH